MDRCYMFDTPSALLVGTPEILHHDVSTLQRLFRNKLLNNSTTTLHHANNCVGKLHPNIHEYPMQQHLQRCLAMPARAMPVPAQLPRQRLLCFQRIAACLSIVV